MTGPEASGLYAVSGLDCASCARSVEKAVGGVDGVEACELDFTSARLRVQGDANPLRVIERVRALGYDAEPVESGAGPRSEPDDASVPAPTSLLGYLISRGDARLALIGGTLLLPGLLFHEIMGWEGLWIEIPALLAVALAGGPIVRTAWRGLRMNRELNIQALMTVAVAGALVIGAWVEAGMVVVLFAIGEALEGYAGARARGAIRGLMVTAPDAAVRIRRNGETGTPAQETVPVAELVPGDVVLIRPGDRFPIDGRVLAGSTLVDEAALTGECVPLLKEVGSQVLAGSVNGAGVVEVEVGRAASDTALHRMIRMVEEAQGRRARVHRFIDRFARIYTPAVVGLAVFVAVVPPLAFGAPFLNPDAATFGWFYRALALLVVACPCALVISVPASLVSAITNAARTGVLVKGGAHIEALARVRVVAFDKTGTLTEGALTVAGVRSVDCTGVCEDGAGDDPCPPCDELLALAAAVEERSEHPVGRAVAAAARNRLAPERIPVTTGHRALPGRGITASYNGRRVTIGSRRFLAVRLPGSGDHGTRTAADARQGRTPVVVELDGRFLGTITLADVPRPSARAGLRDLHDLGLRTVLLSGDSPDAVAHLARHVGIDDVRADLLPEDKVRAIDDLRRDAGPVAMVGDGINDAPALAAADIGIAVGGGLGGTDQAREAAAATLMHQDLRVLARTIRLARAAMRTVHLNVGLALGIKGAFLGLVLLGMGTLWMAVLADVGATLLVTLLGMRLLRWESPEWRREGLGWLLGPDGGWTA